MFNNYGFGNNIPNYNYNHFQQQSMPKTNIEYVNGIEGAKAFPIPPNCKMLLVDGDSKTFFIKSTDYEGRPTLERYSYAPFVESAAVPPPQYVTVEQFETFKKDIENKLNGGT